jgi:signal peptidase I
MILKWFLSSSVRHATAMRRHVHKLLRHQRDILAPQAVAALETAIGDIRKATCECEDKSALEKQMEDFAKIAEKWLKPYPNAAWRENIEVLLVALAVAMGIRTFVLQPFKIPTGSMQPTLYGVTSVPDFSRLMDIPESARQSAMSAVQIPTGLQRVKDWFAGISYLEVRAKCDGELEAVNEPVKILIFGIFQTLQIGGKTHWILFPPDYGSSSLLKRAGLQLHTPYKQGEEVVRFKIAAGDHLFVDRLTFNFRAPQRGEIVVFDTHGIERLGRDQQDTFYIKRLVGLGDEKLTLKQDHVVSNVPTLEIRPVSVPVGHLVVNGQAISTSSPHFQNVYSFDGVPVSRETIPYQENHYVGHAMIWGLSPGREFHVEPGHYFVMGDNTMNSSDSRWWGDFPQEKVIGRSFFVYWPITERFGTGYQR